VKRLERTSTLLDAQLQMMQSDIDEELLGEFLPPARGRVSEVIGAVRHVRQAALVVMGGEMDDDLRRLTADVALELQALQTGVDALRTLTTGDLVDDGCDTAKSGVSSWLCRGTVR
jgi:hypothetical protein